MDLGPKRADFKSEGADFRSERADSRPERAWGGTNKRKSGQKKQTKKSPVFYRTSSPLGPLPKKVVLSLKVLS